MSNCVVNSVVLRIQQFLVLHDTSKILQNYWLDSTENIFGGRREL